MFLLFRLRLRRDILIITFISIGSGNKPAGRGISFIVIGHLLVPYVCFALCVPRLSDPSSMARLLLFQVYWPIFIPFLLMTPRQRCGWSEPLKLVPALRFGVLGVSPSRSLEAQLSTTTPQSLLWKYKDYIYVFVIFHVIYVIYCIILWLVISFRIFRSFPKKLHLLLFPISLVTQ